MTLPQVAVRSFVRFRGMYVVGLWALVAFMVAWSQRGEGSDGFAINVMGSLTIPLVAFAMAAAALGGGGYAGAVEPLLRLGAPVRAAFGLPFLTAAIPSALFAAVLALVGTALTHAAGTPARDVFTTTWVAALGGFTYAILFVAASALSRGGGGRSFALAVDLVLGAGGGLTSALTPRGHLRNLLGGEAPLEISQRASSVVLVTMAALFVVLAARRVWRRA